MRLGLSTHLFLHQRLSISLLDAMQRSGVEAVEVLAARHHFDYTSRSVVRELGAWFRDHAGIRPSLHQPVSTDAEWSRHSASALNLTDNDKSRRILAMDETKRCIEAAEFLPFQAISLRLGNRGDHPRNHPQFLEHALTAIEHLKAFATPLGVRLLLETLENDLTTPERLLEILQVGHFSTVGVTLDLGHAHLADHRDPGADIDASFDLLGPHLAEIHLADNDGNHDLHLWPGAAPRNAAGHTTGIDWPNVARQLQTLFTTRAADQAPAPVLLFEIAPDPQDTSLSTANLIESALSRYREAADTLRRQLDHAQALASEPQDAQA